MKNIKAFTLTEVMVTLLIVGVLSVVAVPAFKNAFKKNNVAVASSELNNLLLSLQNQYNVNLVYPTTEGVYKLGQNNEPIPRVKYIPSTDVLRNFEIHYKIGQTFFKIDAVGVTEQLKNCVITIEEKEYDKNLKDQDISINGYMTDDCK